MHRWRHRWPIYIIAVLMLRQLFGVITAACISGMPD
jgi:hypothetical protein